MFSNNNSTAAEFFKGKEEYDAVFPIYSKNRVYDIWYKRPYYGKIDTKGIVVYPQERFLKVLDVKKNIKAINFVADAFLELQNFIRRAKSKKAFPSDFFGKFSVKKAWLPLPQLYDEYFASFIFDPFLNHYIANKTIKSFMCFSKEYIKYVKDFASDISFTQNEFILSPNCTNKISGLVLDLTNDPHDNEEIKVKDYLDKFQYTSFVSVCKSHGFRINKNAPWQIIADLSSSKMRLLAKRNGIDILNNNLFDQYYYTAVEIDYANFKTYLWQMYASYYAVNTTYSKINTKLKSVQYGSPMFSDFMTTVTRELPVEVAGEKDTFIERYGEKYFLSMYLKIRLIENNQDDKFTEFNKRLLEYYDIGNIELALKYIDKKIINAKIYKTEELNPYYFNA